MKRKSFCANIWAKLVKFGREKSFYSANSRILAAVSGGPDSVCLLHFLAQMARIHRFEVIACHVNHGIRGKSANADEKFVRKLCADMGIEYRTTVFDVPAYARKHKLSIEHAARKLRYKFLIKTARSLECASIAVGHHLDDHAETVLLNILRGTSPQGFLGIPSRRPAAESIDIIRPLLCIDRAEVMEYLKQHELKWRHDETNDSDKFLRNWVRRKLLPLMEGKQPRLRQHLSVMSEKLAGVLKTSESDL